MGNNFKEVAEFKKRVNATRIASKNFVSLETEHFRLRYEEGPDEVLIHYAEEVLEKSYHTLGKILEYYPQEKVLLPSEDQYKVPSEFREEILDAMKKETPKNYEQLVNEYYRELVQ